MAKKMSAHDKKVSRVAGGYRSQGWDVQAHLPGQEKPDSIGGKIPDVIARRGGKVRVIEVETPQSARTEHAKEQRRAFRSWADRGNTRSFRQTKAK